MSRAHRGDDGRHDPGDGPVTSQRPPIAGAGLCPEIRQARAVARDRAWPARGELTGAELPGSRAAGSTIDQVVIDFDATLVTAHSDKQGAKGNFKGGFGYHPVRREALSIRAEVKDHRRRPVAAGR